MTCTYRKRDDVVAGVVREARAIQRDEGLRGASVRAAVVTARQRRLQ